jgi:hypothetical protein
MATYKNTSGDYTITANNGDGTITLNGDVNITGTSTSVDETNLAVEDKLITLNNGETGAGISGTPATSGIEVERGSETNARFVFDESDDTWKVDTGTGSLTALMLGSGTGITAVVDDTTPQLGGDLDVNGNNISSASNNNVVIAPNGTGMLRVESEIELDIKTSNPSGNAGYQTVFGKAVGNGGSGVFFTNPDGTTDELVSKTKAMVFGLIF